MKLSVILPSRNEAEGLEFSIPRIKAALHGYQYEIIVSDSSTDGSAKVVLKHGVKLVSHQRQGYGAAYNEAFPHASGDYILMADPDGTYDFHDWLEMISMLESGCDLVMGNRMHYQTSRIHIPLIRRVIGNPLLTLCLNRLHGLKLSDSQCGIRAFKRKILDVVRISSDGMEFASEMLIQFKRKGLKIAEIPVRYHPRIGTSKLIPCRDGFRHVMMICGTPPY